MKRFGHPYHPPCVHLPIGCFAMVLPLDLVGWLAGNEFCWTCSRLLLAVGLASGVLAAISGLIDYVTIRDSSPGLRPAIRHLTAMLVSMSLFAASGCMQIYTKTPPADWQPLVVTLAAAGWIMLVYGGWLGGKLVYHHGIGQQQTKAQRDYTDCQK